MSKKINKKNPLWGGRFEGSTDSLTQSFSASIDIDKELYAVDMARILDRLTNSALRRVVLLEI